MDPTTADGPFIRGAKICTYVPSFDDSSHSLTFSLATFRATPVRIDDDSHSPNEPSPVELTAGEEVRFPSSPCCVWTDYSIPKAPMSFKDRQPDGMASNA